MKKHRKNVISLSCFMILSIIFPCQGMANDISKKDIVTYGAWTVTINYQNASNPTCQISANAQSPDMKYSGIITIWRDYKTNKELTRHINIEVGVIDIEKKEIADIDSAFFHKFGNDVGSLRGITRDREGMLIFLATKRQFKKLISSPDNIFVASTKDKTDNEISIGASLEGIREAADKCGIFDQ